MHLPCDRVCRPIRPPCDAERAFEARAPTNTSDRECANATVCSPGEEYEAAPLNPKADRVCATVRMPCIVAEEWEAAEPTPTRDRVCKPLTVCGEDRLERKPPTPSSDRVCHSLTEVSAAGDHESVVELIQRGAVDINAKNAYGHTALHDAVSAPDTEERSAIVGSLLAGGADPAVQNSKGHTALHVAADVGNADAASSLLVTGVDVNAVDGEGNTPLHFAAEMGHAPVAEVLLEGGAAVHQQNDEGQTAAHLTEKVRWHEKRHQEITHVIRRFGGELRRQRI